MGSSSSEYTRKGQASLEILVIIAAVTFIVSVIMIDAMTETHKTLILSGVKNTANYEIGMMIVQNGACAGTRISHLTMTEDTITVGLEGPCAPEQEEEQNFLNILEQGVETNYCGVPEEGYSPDGVISCGGQDYALEYYSGG